jgi:hypothetical protein
MGIVAPTAHQSGRMKSAIRLRIANVAQKIFRSINQVYSSTRGPAPETKAPDPLTRVRSGHQFPDGFEPACGAKGMLGHHIRVTEVPACDLSG